MFRLVPVLDLVVCLLGGVFCKFIPMSNGFVAVVRMSARFAICYLFLRFTMLPLAACQPSRQDHVRKRTIVPGAIRIFPEAIVFPGASRPANTNLTENLTKLVLPSPTVIDVAQVTHGTV